MSALHAFDALTTALSTLPTPGAETGIPQPPVSTPVPVPTPMPTPTPTPTGIVQPAGTKEPTGMTPGQIVFGILTFAAAAAAAIFSGVGVFRKDRQDSRAEWWRRFQWAAERAIGNDEGVRNVGIAAMEVLTEGELAGKDEKDLAIEIMNAVIDIIAAGSDNEGEEAIDEPEGEQQERDA